MPYQDNTNLEVISNTFLNILLSYKEANDEEKKWLKYLLQLGCRKLENFITPRVSVRAQEVGYELHIGNLSDYSWHDQKSKMLDPDRSTFHFEHVMTVSSMVSELLSLESPSIDSIENVTGKAEIAWILKSENEALDKSGFKSTRSEDPWEEYHKCGIRMV